MGRSADVPRVAGGTGGDDAGCHILHMDMDAFFASVEIRRQPQLRGRPVLVGGGVRGVVAAASYEARRYGVRSAMSMTRALQLCPHAVVLPPDRAAYSAASAEVMTILRSITPLVEPLSLDEAFLDVSGAISLLGRPADIAVQIRSQVSAALGLTCSVGVAPSKFVAKVASARCKPDGMLVVPAAGVLQFLHPLPVTVLWGVGERTAAPLHGLGIRTIGDLAATPIAALRRAVGVATAEHLAALASGQDPRSVSPAEGEKSVSSDRTFDLDLTEFDQVSRELLRLSDEVARRLRAKSLVARTIGIKIRFADFRTVTRVRTLPGWVDSASTLHHTALDLYQGLDLDRPRIRLVGVKAEGLQAGESVSVQLSFDDAGPVAAGETARTAATTAPGAAVSSEAAGPSLASAAAASRPTRAIAVARATRRRTALPAALDRAADHVKARFGQQAVGFATLLPQKADPALQKADSSTADGHPE